MIGKIIKGTSFSKCLAYCLADKQIAPEDKRHEMELEDGLIHVNRAEVLEYNLCFGNQKELAEQFRDVAKLSRNVEKPVFHLTLRAAPGDQLTRAAWLDIGRAAAKEFGFSDHQFLTILHKDTREPHIHIVANRVGYDGKAAGDSNSYARMAALSRRIELEHGLKKVPSPRRFLSVKERQIPRQDVRKMNLTQVIASNIRQSSDYAAFEKRMREAGYTVIKGRGIAFEDGQKVRIKGSEVGFSLQTITRVLEDNRRQLSLSTGLRRQSGVGNNAVNTADTALRGTAKLVAGLVPTKILSEALKPDYSQDHMTVPWELTAAGQQQQKKKTPKPKL